MIPEFSDHPDDVNVTRTELLELTCAASGFPRPSIEWSHNETEVMDGGRITVTHTPSGVEITSTLEVANTFSNDSGNYRCVAVGTPFSNVSSDTALVLIQGEPLVLRV